jgi:hypothetical protein
MMVTPAPSNSFLPWWDNLKAPRCDVHNLIHQFVNNVLQALYEEKKLFKIPTPQEPSTKEIEYTWYQNYNVVLLTTEKYSCKTV